MPVLARVACWAIVLTAIAVASRYDLIDKGAARALMIVFPLIAWINIAGGRARPAASSRSARA